MNALKMPDVTPAQKLAIAKVIVAVCTMLGLKVGIDVANSLVVAVIGIVSGVSSVWMICDTVIRGNRAKMKAAGGAPDALVSDR